MHKKKAFELVQQYVNGWKENNSEKIFFSLSQDCVVIESHGPAYQSLADVKCWFDLWLQAKSIVTRWDILAFYYDQLDKTAFFQWEFACVSNGQQYSFPGASVIKFNNQKIIFIQEYRMTHPIFNWMREKLISE